MDKVRDEVRDKVTREIGFAFSIRSERSSRLTRSKLSLAITLSGTRTLSIALS